MLDYLAVGGIAFGLAYWVTGTGLALWRSIVGALLGFTIGWVGGTAIFAFVLFAGDFGVSSFDRVIGRNFWFAFAGAGYGVHRGRKKLKAANTSLGNAFQKSAIVKTTATDAYAAALAEIDENRLNKGVWARSFAESGGDESKAKALYIKARAESINGAAIWADTRPPEVDDADNKAAGDGGHVGVGSQGPVSTPKWPVRILGGIAIVGVLGTCASQGYQGYTKQQTAAANPAQAPAPQLDLSESQKAPNSTQARTPQPDITSTTPAFGANDKIIGGPYEEAKGAWSGNPFDKFDTVNEISVRARQFSQLNEPKAWAAVIAWQEREMQLHRTPDNEALHQAVGTVLAGLNDNKGLCWPGRIRVVNDAQASNSMPVGTMWSELACER